ncbi:MAG TPA: hypothetical protein VGR71_10615 [Nitrospira sp.]|nr:hypothetical protein [Nitrospira sp.]
MAATKKLKDFFEGRRREMVLDDWKPLKTAGGELRLKLLLRMPLLNKDLKGVPTEISEAFNAMSADESPIDSSKLGVMYDGMTVEFFSDDVAKLPWTNGKEGISGGLASVTGAMFDKFVVIAKGKAEKRTVDLQFVCYLAATVGIKDWAFELLHGKTYAECVYSQSEMGNEFMQEEPAGEDDSQDSADEQMTLVPAGSADDEMSEEF